MNQYICQKDKGREWDIQSTFRLKNSNLLPNLRNTLEIIKSTYNQKCLPFKSLPATVYKFKTNIFLSEMIKVLEKIEYTIHEQIMNFNGKIIGIIVKNNKENNKKRIQLHLIDDSLPVR